MTLEAPEALEAPALPDRLARLRYELALLAGELAQLEAEATEAAEATETPDAKKL